MRCTRLLLTALLMVGLAAAPVAAAPPELSATGAVLWDPADQRVLYGHHETVGRPMASTTKIMTTLLALEAGAADETLTVSPGAASQTGASLGLVAGQRLPVRSVLAGLMLRSGNDASQAVAEHVAGSEAAFVERMNSRAAELDLTATHFLNASGLTDDLGHHASPLDLARLAEVAMADPDFAGWAGSRQLTVPGLPPMENRNELIGRYPGATGVKTGFTTLSGLSLVASASRAGRTLYAVVLGSEDNFGDGRALLDHGFDDFRRAQPLSPGDTATVYRWADDEVGLVADGALGVTVPVDGSVVTWRTAVDPARSRPVRAGAVLGEAHLLLDGDVVRTVPLRAANDVGDAEAAPAAIRAGAAVQEALRAFVRLRETDRAA